MTHSIPVSWIFIGSDDKSVRLSQAKDLRNERLDYYAGEVQN